MSIRQALAQQLRSVAERLNPSTVYGGNPKASLMINWETGRGTVKPWMNDDGR